MALKEEEDIPQARILMTTEERDEDPTQMKTETDPKEDEDDTLLATTRRESPWTAGTDTETDMTPKTERDLNPETESLQLEATLEMTLLTDLKDEAPPLTPKEDTLPEDLPMTRWTLKIKDLRLICFSISTDMSHASR